MPIELREYDPRWPAMFEEAAHELHGIEPDWVIEHMGSTSVPGLAAKPVIDIAIRRTGPDDLKLHRTALEVRGEK